MQEQRLARVALAQPAGEQFAHFAKLGEDQHLAVAGVNLVDQFEEAFRLAGERGVGLPLLQVLRRMVADLLQCQNCLLYTSRCV